MNAKRMAMMILVAAGVLLWSATVARAVTKMWAGGDGNWNDPSKWSPSGVPSPASTDIVNITNISNTYSTVTYNLSDPGVGSDLGLVTINNTGSGRNTLSITGNYGLRARALFVGGWTGSGPASGSAAVVQSAGAIYMATNTDLVLGHGAGSTGIYTQTGGLFSASQNEFVGLSGTGIYDHSDGINLLNFDPGSILSVGHNLGSRGTYNLSATGTVLSSAAELVGYFGVGVFNQTGGENRLVDNTLYLGYDVDALGTYVLSSGSLRGAVLEFVGYSGEGIFNQSGGTNSVSGTLIVGNIANSLGAYTLSGGALFAVDTVVGFLGSGTFDHSGGTHSLTASLYLGNEASGVGTYKLSGTGSLSVAVDEYIGNLGGGTFIQTGGTNVIGGSLWIAAKPGSNGTYSLSGGSVTLNNGSAHVGGIWPFGGAQTPGGTGVLTISSTGVLTTSYFLLVYGTPGSAVHLDGGTIHAANIDNKGRFNLSGSTALATVTGTFTNSGLLRGTGTVMAAVTNTASGDVRAGADDHLQFIGASFLNQGWVEAIGGAAGPAEIAFSSPVDNSTSNSLIVGSNSILRFNSGLTNQASLALSIGANNVFGDINNAAAGKIIISGGAGATFYDDIVQNGTFRVSKAGSTTSVAVILGAFSGTGGSTGGGDIFFEGDLRPGNSPATVTFNNNIAFGEDASLQIELGGATPGSLFDQIIVNGELALGGSLDVSLINGFSPGVGQVFHILGWGSVAGTFSEINLPTLPGLAWNTSKLYITGDLSVVLPGDFNFDNHVDAADYAVWRKTDGTPAGYSAWRTHFGQTAPASGAGVNSTSVPEPATPCLLLCAAVAFGAARGIVATASGRR